MKPPLPLWGVSLVLSILGVVTGVFVGGSLAGYVAGLIGTVLAFVSLYINRRRQMNRDYDFGYPWFRIATSSVYILGVVATLIHIVRYAIELASA